jgi:hypothetical protein
MRYEPPAIEQRIPVTASMFGQISGTAGDSG